LTLGEHRFDCCGRSRSRIAGGIGVRGGGSADLVEEVGEKSGGRE
jgi:hypothetical protein